MVDHDLLVLMCVIVPNLAPHFKRGNICMVSDVKNQNQWRCLGNSIDYDPQLQHVSPVARASSVPDSGAQLCLTTKNWSIFCSLGRT